MTTPALRLTVFVLGLLACLTGSIRAADGAEVEVMSLKFNSVRAPNGAPNPWLEADIALDARPAPSNPGRMVGRVKVALTLGFELPGTTAGPRRIEYYRAEAECVALEAGRADVRFYLPPELVKRDQLFGEPKYWGVELVVGGKAVVPGKGAYSTPLSTPNGRKNFQSTAAAAATANDGLLVPQYLTPFENEYPRATPSFVRREGR